MLIHVDVDGRHLEVTLQQAVGFYHQVIFGIAFDDVTAYVQSEIVCTSFQACYLEGILQVDGVEYGFQVMVARRDAFLRCSVPGLFLHLEKSIMILVFWLVLSKVAFFLKTVVLFGE